MQKLVNFTKQYIGVISIVLAVCILLTYTFSSFIVTTGKKKVAEMYIGQLKYSMTIEGKDTNTLTVPAGETIVDVDITNLNAINTYYKLLFEKNSNIEISYYESTKDTDEVVTNYGAGGDLINASASTTLKIKIKNSSTDDQTLIFKVSGGYGTNTLTDVTVPSEYSEITTIESTKSNTYFCKTSDTLIRGRKYVNGQYTYKYEQDLTGNYIWENMMGYNKGWGVSITDRTSTDDITSNLCTYINNKPVISMDFIFAKSNATSIDLTGFDTSNVISMYGLFENTVATEIKGLENFDTSNVLYMGRMFQNSKIDSINLTGFNTSKVKNMNSMFEESQASSIDISSFDTSNVTSMHSMFYDTKATSVDVSSFDTSKVKWMNYMFSGSQFTELDLRNFDTSNVEQMNGMFKNSKATIIKGLENFNTSKVTNMSSMFYYNPATSLDLSSFDTSNVTDMSYMFYIDRAKEIKGLEKFDTSKVTNMHAMFNYSSVTTLDLTNFDTHNVTDMGSMFQGNNAKVLDISSFDTSNVTDMSGMFMNTGSNITTIDISNFNTSKVTDMSSMFQYSDATEIKGLNTINTSNVTDMSSMFDGYNGTSLDLSAFNTSNVINMSNMFYNIKILSSLDLSSFDTSKVTKMKEMFNRCTNLTTIKVSSKFDTSNVTASTDMFTGSTNLVGGNGTKYSTSYLDKTYARIDTASTPGYFTAK